MEEYALTVRLPRNPNYCRHPFDLTQINLGQCGDRRFFRLHSRFRLRNLTLRL